MHELAKAPVVHGEWMLEIEEYELGDDYYTEFYLECSVCGRIVPCLYIPPINEINRKKELEEYPTCPNCEAKMNLRE